MEGNKDEAFRCIELAKSFIEQNNYEKAEKLLKKSLRMYPTHQAENLYERFFGQKNNASQRFEQSSESSSYPQSKKSTELHLCLYCF